MGPTDAELMAQWRAGDPTAFAALVRRWQGPVGRFLGRQLGPGGAAADVCQEVFLRLFRAGPRYHEAGTFEAWLFRIAVNLARDSLRRRRVTIVFDEADASVDESADCERREMAAATAAAVAALPQPLREAFSLRHDQDMSFEAMAKLLRTPASTLKSRYSLALRKLRVALQSWAPEGTHEL